MLGVKVKTLTYIFTIYFLTKKPRMTHGFCDGVGIKIRCYLTRSNQTQELL